jgi:hypothetical protein
MISLWFRHLYVDLADLHLSISALIAYYYEKNNWRNLVFLHHYCSQPLYVLADIGRHYQL